MKGIPYHRVSRRDLLRAGKLPVIAATPEAAAQESVRTPVRGRTMAVIVNAESATLPS